MNGARLRSPAVTILNLWRWVIWWEHLENVWHGSAEPTTVVSMRCQKLGSVALRCWHLSKLFSTFLRCLLVRHDKYTTFSRACQKLHAVASVKPTKPHTRWRQSVLYSLIGVLCCIEIVSGGYIGWITYEYAIRASLLLYEPCNACLKNYFGCDLIPMFIPSFGNIDRCEYRGNCDPYACGSKMSSWANPTICIRREQGKAICLAQSSYLRPNPKVAPR